MAKEGYGIDFVAGFLVGALVGAAVALLFAPQSGDQTRGIIRERGIELGQRAGEMSDEARRRAEELQAQARERAAGLQSQAKEKADELQGKVKQAVEEGKAVAAERRQELLTQLEGEPTTGEEVA
jgi:gas vesicle protein